jgi:hypothetical protein
MDENKNHRRLSFMLSSIKNKQKNLASGAHAAQTEGEHSISSF